MSATGTKAEAERSQDEVELMQNSQMLSGLDFAALIFKAVYDEVVKRLLYARHSLTVEQRKDICFQLEVPFGSVSVDGIIKLMATCRLEQLGAILAIVSPEGFVPGATVPRSAIPVYTVGDTRCPRSVRRGVVHLPA